MTDHATNKWGYAKGCPCTDCRAGMAAYSRHLRRMRAYGRTDWTSTDEVRAHIQRLMDAGMGVRTIAQLADVEMGAISRTLYSVAGRPPQTRMRIDRAQRILAISVPRLVGVTGARRRLQALGAIGWDLRALERESGINRMSLQKVRSGQTSATRGDLAQRIGQLYDRLWDQAPPTKTPYQRRAVTAQLNRALSLGWAPPLAWDDIDDPDEQPTGWQRSRREDEHRTPAATEARWRLELGEPIDAVARDLGVTADYLRYSVRRAA